MLSLGPRAKALGSRVGALAIPGVEGCSAVGRNDEGARGINPLVQEDVSCSGEVIRACESRCQKAIPLAATPQAHPIAHHKQGRKNNSIS